MVRQDDALPHGFDALAGALVDIEALIVREAPKAAETREKGVRLDKTVVQFQNILCRFLRIGGASQ